MIHENNKYKIGDSVFFTDYAKEIYGKSFDLSGVFEVSGIWNKSVSVTGSDGKTYPSLDVVDRNRLVTPI